MDSTLGCLLVLALVLALGMFWSFVSWHLKRKREHEEIIARVEKRQELEDVEEDARSATAAWLKIRDYFPFLQTPKVESLSGEAIREAIVRTLLSHPHLGTFDRTLPAPLLPPEERRRHLYIVGKTGSGKTTFLEHLLLSDLTAGRGVGVVGPEGDLFGRLLSLLPKERLDDLIYFAPGNSSSPLSFNPLLVEEGEDRSKAAEDLFTIFKRTLNDDLGPRMEPILQNAFAALVGRERRTFWDVRRILSDSAFRREVTERADSYVRDFWRETFPRFPEGAALPILSRLDQFLRPPTIRHSLCRPLSSFSFREILGGGKILFVDLSGLSEEGRLLLGQMILSKFQLELMRRERGGGEAPDFFLYCDEFQSFAGSSEGVWRELLSRGRKYGLALTLANQYPGQLSTALQAEIFGNVNSLISFALGRRDAEVVRKELLVKREKRGEMKIEPLEGETLLELPVGEAVGKLGGGRAVRLSFPSPLKARERDAARVARLSWERYPMPETDPLASSMATEAPHVTEPESFLE